MNIKILGEGEPLLLIHGWGMSGRVWEPIEKTLSQHFKLIMVDLPGMGLSEEIEDYTLANLVEELYLIMPPRVSILGWSLGGLIALKYSLCYPEDVKRLFLVSTTPCFINSEDWAYGIDKSVLNKFFEELTEQYSKTVTHFFSLQLFGSENRKEIIRFLNSTFIEQLTPKINSLMSALVILRDTDLRRLITTIDIPTLIIVGEKDKITPKAASVFMQSKIKKSIIKVFDNASHIPFLSHSNDFLNEIIKSLQLSND